MKTVYFISIIAIVFLGLAHAALTFKNYKKATAEAFWFFSAALALIVSGLINYINYQIAHPLIENTTRIANLLMVLFSILLAWNVQKITMITVAVAAILLLICSAT